MSAELAKILPFRSGTATPTQDLPIWSITVDDDRTILTKSSSVFGGSVATPHTTERISIDELYPDMLAVKPELSTSLRLLGRALIDLENAVAEMEQGHEIVADDGVQRFQALLPELFMCRDLSSGFGAIINSLINVLQNCRGEFLSLSQITSIRNLIAKLRSEPFIDFDQAVDEIMKLEEQGFVVEPEQFEILADWLDD